MMQRVASTVLPTRWGNFRTDGFERAAAGGGKETAIVLIHGDLTTDLPLLRIHSQCFTGDVLGCERCDCGRQLDLAMRAIARGNCGLLIYEQQEGRGIGLIGKRRAYALQDRGLDTIEANYALGFRADHRDFALPVDVLTELGIRRVRLLSNNPDKVRALVNAGIDVVEQLSCEAPPSPHAIPYLRAKKERMGHTLTLV